VQLSTYIEEDEMNDIVERDEECYFISVSTSTS